MMDKMIEGTLLKNLPVIVKFFEKNKKRDWIMSQLGSLNMDNASLKNQIYFLSNKYDEALDIMKEMGIIDHETK